MEFQTPRDLSLECRPILFTHLVILMFLVPSASCSPEICLHLVSSKNCNTSRDALLNVKALLVSFSITASSPSSRGAELPDHLTSSSPYKSGELDLGKPLLLLSFFYPLPLVVRRCQERGQGRFSP